MYTITLLGDIMLGRLVDQLLPQHVEEPEEATLANHFQKHHSQLQSYTHASPWGSTISLLKNSDLVLGNLETAATTHDRKWPNKVFNYRMHPENLKCLAEANISYVSLANNHTLDFSKQGLFETVKSVKDSGVAFAGAGQTMAEAREPAILKLSSKNMTAKDRDYIIHLYSASDHPSDWQEIPEFNLLQYTSDFRRRIASDLKNSESQQISFRKPDLKIISLHWGPNYSWKPEPKLIDLAHFLIDECDIDIIHGHSSHHIQGVEIYKGKLIVYGCGDFVDDYAVNNEYRNDLSAAWNIILGEASEEQKLEMQRLEVFPNRIKLFQAGLLPTGDADHDWICRQFRQLCDDFGTRVENDLGTDGQMIINLK